MKKLKQADWEHMLHSATAQSEDHCAIQDVQGLDVDSGHLLLGEFDRACCDGHHQMEPVLSARIDWLINFPQCIL